MKRALALVKLMSVLKRTVCRVYRTLNGPCGSTQTLKDNTNTMLVETTIKDLPQPEGQAAWGFSR
jgi:hypothetical protein